jgi:hypothetical protein
MRRSQVSWSSIVVTFLVLALLCARGWSCPGLIPVQHQGTAEAGQRAQQHLLLPAIEHDNRCIPLQQVLLLNSTLSNRSLTLLTGRYQRLRHAHTSYDHNAEGLCTEQCVHRLLDSCTFASVSLHDRHTPSRLPPFLALLATSFTCRPSLTKLDRSERRARGVHETPGKDQPARIHVKTTRDVDTCTRSESTPTGNFRHTITV